MRLWRFGSLLLLTFACLCGAAYAAQDRASFDTVDLDTTIPLDRLAARLITQRVVFIGEIHTRYDHHLNQLEIIRRLHELDANLVIGVEYFQQPYQAEVDDYIAGRTSEDEFLRATQYFRTWGYDYRLYAPIFRYAREQHIAVRALNVPTALPSTVARVGLGGVPERLREYLPRDIEPADAGYRARLRDVFEEHQAAANPEAFDHFVQAQLVWDEGMAESAAAYLEANPGMKMVILAGAGHIAFGSGIPMRLERRIHETYATVLNSGETMEPNMADYILLSKQQELPAAGVLGVTLEQKKGECRIGSVNPAGAGGTAGLKKGDLLVAIDGQMIKTVPDVRLALWNKKPGERVDIKVLRKSRFRAAASHDLEIELQASRSPGGAS
jgi:uncharacterized iron-regulated protein